MGIYISSTFKAFSSEEDLLIKLNRIRRRIMNLPVISVSEIVKVDPVYNILTFRELEEQGYPIPELIRERLGDYENAPYPDIRLSMEMVMLSSMPKSVKSQFYRQWRENRFEWREEDYPETFNMGPSFSTNRAGVLHQFDNVLLRYGYAFTVDPGEGCETLLIQLNTFRVAEETLWIGGNSTKTQYAVNYPLAHENVCRVLDLMNEEGLLLKVHDNSKFYQARRWTSGIRKRVREELSVAITMSSLINMGVDAAQKEGVEIVNLTPKRTYQDPFRDLPPPTKEDDELDAKLELEEETEDEE